MSSSDWWARQLNNAPTQPQAPVGRPLNLPPMPQSQRPMDVMPAFQTPPTSKAQSANQVLTCPDCGSDNYMSPSPQIAARCLDCGYPVQQSGSRYGSLAGSKIDGPAKAASGNSATSGFNPMPEGYGADGRKL